VALGAIDRPIALAGQIAVRSARHASSTCRSFRFRILSYVGQPETSLSSSVR
jgi:hypothetical protein